MAAAAGDSLMVSISAVRNLMLLRPTNFVLVGRCPYSNDSRLGLYQLTNLLVKYRVFWNRNFTTWLCVCHVRILCRNGDRYGHSCYGMRIGNRTQTFEWYHFQWPWTTPNPAFKVTPIFNAEYNSNNNNNNQDNVYGAVIMAEPLREFTRFIWWM